MPKIPFKLTGEGVNRGAGWGKKRVERVLFGLKFAVLTYFRNNDK